MKRIGLFLLVLSVLLCAVACGQGTDTPETQTTAGETEPSVSMSATQATPESTAPETTQAVTEPTVPATTEETMPENIHSELYIEGYTPEQIVTYFCEVVLDTEYATGEGDFRLVQKWDDTIRYYIRGEPTDYDLTVLTKLFDGLNAIEGFPGIEPVDKWEQSNLCLYFLDKEDFYGSFGGAIGYEDADGAVEYWYFNDSNIIHDASVGYRTDVYQIVRNSVLQEEIVNALGVSDTVLREDSIVYQNYSQTQELSEIDWLILKLLYHPRIRPGMDADACREVILELYY